MFKINEYSNFFIKKSFNLPQYKYKKHKKIIEKRDNLFYEVFHKINQMDISSYNFKQYNELQEKTKIAEGINNIKIKNKEQILNNLMYETNINLITLNAMCKYYKINLIYINDKICIKMCNNNEEPLFINNENKFLTHINVDEYYEIVNLEKPLNSVSYYKLNELVDYAIKLKLPYEKIKKADLYNSIYNYLVKLNIFKID